MWNSEKSLQKKKTDQTRYLQGFRIIHLQLFPKRQFELSCCPRLCLHEPWSENSVIKSQGRQSRREDETAVAVRCYKRFYRVHSPLSVYDQDGPQFNTAYKFSTILIMLQRDKNRFHNKKVDNFMKSRF